MLDLLRERLTTPTARGLADAVTAAVGDGSVLDGQRLPPIREVARALRLSPTTVSAAWSLLARAGAIETDGRRGTRVTSADLGTPRRYRRAVGARTPFALDLATGVPDPALLPNLTPALRGVRAAQPQTSYLEDPVDAALAQVLRANWPYPAPALTVVDGAMDALDLICSTLLRFGDRVAVENPCFPPLLDLLDALGHTAVGMELDERGVTPPSLRAALDSGVRAVVLQPRAQNPTGASLDEGRAAELAALVAGAAAIVVEDDSAGAVAQSPAISLGRWRPEQTIHIQSFSKSHGPDLRLAAVSGPSALMARITERRLLGQGWTSRLLQSLLADLLTRPESIASVARARVEYARRREAVQTGLATAGIHVAPGDGINLWLPVADEAAALVHLASRGIGAAAGSPFLSAPAAGAHVRLTVGLVPDGHAALARELAAAAQAEPWSGPR